MDSLVRQRAVCKASITRLSSWVPKPAQAVDKYAFKFRLDNLETHFKKYSDIQNTIESSSDDLEKEFADREIVEEKYLATRCKLQNSFDKLDSVVTSSKADATQNIQGGTNIRLPNIDIPIFNGDCMQYGTFIDLFTALITDNARLTSNTEKFYYLKSYLRDEPLALISQLTVNENNFNVALKVLDSRYNNTRQIVAAHFHKLLACNLTKCTASHLRHFNSTAKSVVQSLLNLNITKSDLFDALLVHLLKTKLDFQTKKALEETESNQNLISSDTFFDFLDKRCNILENLLSQDSKTEHTLNPQRGNTSTVITPHHNRVSFFSSQDIASPQAQVNLPSNQVIHRTPLNLNATTPTTSAGCSYCKETGHKIYSCPTFGSLAVQNRHAFVKANRMCFGCLGSRHLLTSCTSTGSCSICRKKHHVLLHLPTNSPKSNVALNSFNRSSDGGGQTGQSLRDSTFVPPNEATLFQHFPDTNSSTPLNSTSGLRPQVDSPSFSPSLVRHQAMVNLTGSHVLLATAKVILYPLVGPPVQARALLDPGSQNSFICSQLARRLEYTIYDQPLLVCGIGNNSQNVSCMTDVVFYSHVDSHAQFKTTCAVVDNITQFLPQVPIDVLSLKIPEHLFTSLADPTLGTPSQIDLLLGAEIYYSLLKPGIHRLGKHLPTLIATHLGWLISGVVPSTCVDIPRPLAFTHSFHLSSSWLPEEKYVDELLEKFWNQEDISAEVQISENDLKAETIFTSSLKTLPEGRFQVDLPLITSQAYKDLGDSFVVAKHRFISLEKRLDKDPFMKKEYKNLLFEYIQLGHGSLVPLSLQTPLLNHKYFVPHLCVVKESSLSTKVRIVFDFSSKSSSQLSLNDISLKGPRVQPELLDILIRFRNFRYALTADIEKMYRQVKLSPEFRFLQNALWRDSPSDHFQCIQLDTVAFGQTSAPYLACRALKEIALRTPQYPDLQEALLSQTYVDDVLTGADSLPELEKLYLALKDTLLKYGFNLHKFCSNSADLSSVYFTDSPSKKDLNLEETPSKVLGIFWNSRSDTLQISSPSPPINCAITKRHILSVVSQCYDPLGLINPVIVQGKLIMQKLWLLKLSWDEPINDPSILKKWQHFLESMSMLPELHIPRYTLSDKGVDRLELHGFSDASSLGYGGCLYLRAIYKDGSVSSQLIIAKSRVAPLNKPLTIPKLELCAMTLLANLFSRVKSILGQQLQISSFILWSDSQIALSWIKSIPSRWSVFVCNRVAQIQKLTHSASWRHVRTHLNPADLLSRGQALDCPSKFWFSGHSFLWEAPHDTAVFDTFSKVHDLPEESKRALVLIAPPINIFLELINRSSSLTKLTRSMAYVFKFLKRIRKSQAEPPTLSPVDVDQAFIFLVLQVQQVSFSALLRTLRHNQTPSDKRFASLNLFIDSDGIIRVGGRLAYADLSFQQKHPILLPASNHLTSLILIREHRRLGHSGPQNVLANVRLRFWPIDGLREIKRIINKCLMCYRFKAITAQQIMANLPKTRISPSRPFQVVGVDFGGPFMIKSSCLKKAPITKCYIALFVCFSSKAVHLELVSDLSTEAFIAALKRFTSKRGLPSVIYSDNATNFVGANNQLKELSAFLINKFSPIYDYLVNSSVDWKFIPPRSPHWGGLWEAGIKSVKSHLLKLFVNFMFTFEQFYTVLAQIEAILNSRPLFPLSSDPYDLNPLTPGHFLIGAPLMSLPEKDISLTAINRLKFWQQCTHVQQNFWKRWSVDYLHQLQNRPKWTTPRTDVKVNDMVLVKDEDTPPLKWPLARVTDVILGKDGKIRSVQVQTSSGVYVRPIVKIIPLPMTEPPVIQQ